MSRPFGTPQELERRRRQAVRAIADGQSRQAVAAVLGVHPNSVSRRVRARAISCFTLLRACERIVQMYSI